MLEAPIVEYLDRKILNEIENGAGTLDMSDWHTCQTTHCLAGWAIHFGGQEGYLLEEKVGPAAAGALIYWKSTGYVPDFYADSEKAITDLRERVLRGQLA